MRLLARREHTRAELERKLRQVRPARTSSSHEVASAAPSDDDIGAALDQLQQAGWLDERRAAESLARSTAGRLGSRRLVQLMRERGFDTELVSQAGDAARASDAAHATALWRRRFGQRAADPRERARQLRFLLGRGFDPSLAARIVDTADPDPEADPTRPDGQA